MGQSIMTNEEKLETLQELQRRGIDLTADEKRLYQALSKPVVKTRPDGTTIVGSQVQDIPTPAQEAVEPGFGDTIGELVQMGKQGIAPTVGQYAGTLAAKLAGATNPLLKLALEGLGAGGGELINQLSNITPRSPENIGLTATIPAITKGIVHGSKQIPKMLPGARAAMHEEGMQTLKKLPDSIGPSQPSEDLYTMVGQAGNPLIPTHSLLAQTQEIKNELSKITLPFLREKTKDIDTLIADIEDLAKRYPKGVPFSELRANQKELNKFIDNLSPTAKEADTTHGTIDYGRFLKIKKGFADAMDDAAKSGTPVAKVLREANRAYRMEINQGELAYQIAKRGSTPVQGTDIVQINPNAISKWVNDPDQKKWRDSVGAQNVQEINNWLNELSKIKPIKHKHSARLGTGERIGLLGGGGLLGGLMGAQFGGQGTAVGAALGAWATEKTGDLVAQAIMSPSGRRWMMRRLQASGGTWGEQESMGLATFMNASSGMTQELTAE